VKKPQLKLLVSSSNSSKKSLKSIKVYFSPHKTLKNLFLKPERLKNSASKTNQTFGYYVVRNQIATHFSTLSSSTKSNKKLNVCPNTPKLSSPP